MPLFDTEEKELKITGITRWAKYGMNRLYVTNAEKASVYYDVVKSEWMIPSEYDEETTIKQVLAFAEAADVAMLNEKTP